MFGIRKRISNISMSKLPKMSRKTSQENKEVLKKQFDAWRKSKNCSALFSKEVEDSFYNHNLGGKILL